MKEKYKLDKRDREQLAMRPRLDDLLKKGKVVTTSQIEEEVYNGGGSMNVVKVGLWHVVPAGFNNKFMCMQNQSTNCRRKVRVTIELI